jgi:hypothetical protein
MSHQIAIRSERARELVTRLSQRHGKSITATIEEALAAMEARDEMAIAERLERWRKVVEPIQNHIQEHGVTFETDDMYDDDGLPI